MVNTIKKKKNPPTFLIYFRVFFNVNAQQRQDENTLFTNHIKEDLMSIFANETKRGPAVKSLITLFGKWSSCMGPSNVGKSNS